MAIAFIRHQVEPEIVPKLGTLFDQYGPTAFARAYKEGFGTRAPLGRCDDNTWGPDVYGYTDNDDHRVELLGA